MISLLPKLSENFKQLTLDNLGRNNLEKNASTLMTLAGCDVTGIHKY